jgi:hypothetical protein
MTSSNAQHISNKCCAYEDLNNFYSSVRLIKSREMSWVGHVA